MSDPRLRPASVLGGILKTRMALSVVIAASLFAGFVSIRAQESGSVAILYTWKAKPGKLQEYNRYIREVAEPIDAEAKRQGAFISVTTFVSQNSDSPWTHMRVFVLKDREQLHNLSKALDSAGVRLEPNEAKRKARAEYAATLRDLVNQEEVDILK